MMQMEQMEEKLAQFVQRCRQAGLKITPQRIAVYKALVSTTSHPTAEEVLQMVRNELPNISLDTVNRTLITLAEIGAAFVVEGSGQPRRYDGGLENHQHFRCLKCGKIFDFVCPDYEHIAVPAEFSDCRILRKTVYLEGFCKECSCHN